MGISIIFSHFMTLILSPLMVYFDILIISKQCSLVHCLYLGLFDPKVAIIFIYQIMMNIFILYFSKCI